MEKWGAKQTAPKMDRAAMITALMESDQSIYEYRRRVQALVAERPCIQDLREEIQKVAASMFPSTSLMITGTSVDDPMEVIDLNLDVASSAT